MHMHLKTIYRAVITALSTTALIACSGSDTPQATDTTETRYTGPIIDMHLHANTVPFPASLCVPWSQQFPLWDHKGEVGDMVMGAMMNPPCEDPIPPVSPEDDALLNATVDAMKKRKIVGVLTGSPDETRRWRDEAPGKFYPAISFNLARPHPTADEMRTLFESGEFVVLGEISNQYTGIAANDPRMDPYWALAEEFGIPVAIHMEQGVTGVSFVPGFENYRSELSNPYLLEDILEKYPRLRVSVMHYAAPLTEQMIAIMYAYPQVNIDIGGMQWFYPRPFFYRQLQSFMEAGLGKRVMFGSDQGNWPGVIEPSIDIIDEAPFLTPEQKADIFYNNAARFLELSDETIAAHLAAAD
ncbi:MAG: amidohydrolase family protein [Pseudomonadota bacterium]